jgi:hypothetical protein
MPIFCLTMAPNASPSAAIAASAPTALRRHEKVELRRSLEDAFISWSDAQVYERRMREVTMKHIAQSGLAQSGLAHSGLAHSGLALATLALAVSIAFFPIGTAMAQSCETQAVSATGKPLHGAAKNSFVKKCKTDACEPKAVSAEGKPLHGAAKNSFMAKCKRDA